MDVFYDLFLFAIVSFCHSLFSLVLPLFLFCFVVLYGVLFDVKCVYCHVLCCFGLFKSDSVLCAFSLNPFVNLSQLQCSFTEKSPEPSSLARLQSHCGSSTLYQTVILAQTETLLLVLNSTLWRPNTNGKRKKNAEIRRPIPNMLRSNIESFPHFGYIFTFILCGSRELAFGNQKQ